MKEAAIKAYCFAVIAVIYMLYVILLSGITLIIGAAIVGSIVVVAPFCMIGLVGYIIKCGFSSASETYKHYHARVSKLAERGAL